MLGPYDGEYIIIIIILIIIIVSFYHLCIYSYNINYIISIILT